MFDFLSCGTKNSTWLIHRSRAIQKHFANRREQSVTRNSPPLYYSFWPSLALDVSNIALKKNNGRGNRVSSGEKWERDAPYAFLRLYY